MEIVVIALVAFFLLLCLIDGSGQNRHYQNGMRGGGGRGMQQPSDMSYQQQPPMQQNPYPQNHPPYGQTYRHQGDSTNMILWGLLFAFSAILILSAL